MEGIQSSDYTRFTMTYGAYVGGALIIVSLLSYITGLYYGNPILLLQYFVLIMGIHMGTTRFRDQYNDGVISYGKILITGVLIVFWGALIYGVYVYVLHKIDPNLIKQYVLSIQKAFNKSFSEEQAKTIIRFYDTFITPFMMALGEIIGKTITGIVFSLIIAIFIKKEK
jgi:hypothetical protein